MNRAIHPMALTGIKFLLIPVVIVFSGCLGTQTDEVVVYAALDKEFSEPVLNQFSDSTGITVLPKFDVESNKTVGLANEIIDQRARQRCDIFWNNEILHTLRLKKLGLLEVYPAPVVSRLPPQFVSTDSDWFGFAARARVLIINTDLIPIEAERPDSIRDLADPKWKGKCTMARPLFGTTATHAAVLFADWGAEPAKEFLQSVAENAVVQGGNKQVALKVAGGQFAWGITDTDDAVIELDRGAPVAIVFPDQGADQQGTLLIPNTLCILKDGPHAEHAKKLVDYLLTPDVENQLADGASAQIPVIQIPEGQPGKSRVMPEAGLKIMETDFQAAADAWDEAVVFLNETFPLGQ